MYSSLYRIVLPNTVHHAEFLRHISETRNNCTVEKNNPTILHSSELTTRPKLFNGNVCLRPALFEFPLTIVDVGLAVLSAQRPVRAVTLYGVAGTPKLSVFMQTHCVELTRRASPWRTETHVYMRQQRDKR